MPTIPLNVILIWTGANGAIPAGWQRETSLDGKFPKGAADGVNPNVTGGSDTHTHTSPVHTHTMVYHAHTGQTVRSSGDFETESRDHPNKSSRDSHYHDWTSDSLQNGNMANGITYAAGDSKPPFHEVIFIKPSTVPAQLHDDIVALFGTGNIPTNWVICDGANGTPNLDDKYLRGAAAGQDAGATGGTLNHTHDVSHNHGVVGHEHQASTGAVGVSSDGERGREGSEGGGGQVVDRNHKHTIFLFTASETASTYSGVTPGTETVEPLYKKIRAIKNNSGNPSKPSGIIGLWLGSLANIPPGWFLCDGSKGTPDLRAYFPKITTTAGEVNETGGNNTHSHAASNTHTHTAPGAHSHSVGVSGNTGPGYGTVADPDGASKPHGHNGSSCSGNTSSWNSAAIQADTSDNQPAFRTVAFIMFKYETYGGAAILGSVLNV